jgi:ankyrin repeat protein
MRVAAERNDVPCARLLLARGADVDAQRQPSGMLSPLEAAAAAGAAGAVALLLDRGAKAKDAALARAARQGHTGALAALLAAGASHATADDDGRAALHHAAAGGHAAAVRALLRARRGADANQNTDRTETYQEEYKTAEVAPVVGNVTGCRATLSGHTHSVSACVFSPDGKTVVTGSFDKTAKLWDAFAPVTKTRTATRLVPGAPSPLQLACAGGNAAVVRMLLDRGADACARSSDGRTPLHATACAPRGAEELCRALLRMKGVDTSAKDAAPPARRLHS